MNEGTGDLRYEMDEERRTELLRRVLQFDVEDAVSRYEAEMGCCVVSLSLQIDSTGRYEMKLETDSDRPARPGVPPLPRMLIFNFGR